MNKVDEERLYFLYVVKELPMHKVADELGVAPGTVLKYLNLFGIETRAPHQGFAGKKHSEEAKKKISAAHKDKTVSTETRQRMSASKTKGGIGHKKLRADGYVAIYFPDHPNSTQDGYIMEHVLVMEALLGRHLAENECVHHINEKKSDNRKENLLLMTKDEHMAYHSKKRWTERKGK